MKSFDYVRASTIAEAIAASAMPGAAYLASGTNLLDLMKTGAARPDRLIDITHLAGLDRVERLADGGLRIGALVRNAHLAHDAAFARAYPAVAEALLSGASAQLRNAATVGGNLLQKTRCAYFYDPFSACNRREPGSGCAALQGENRLHAVLGWSPSCIAVHPSDFCVPLVALDAVVEIEGKGGRREIALDALHRLPGDAPERETVLEPGDLVTALRLPAEAASFAGTRALSQAARAHVVCLRRRLRRGGARHRRWHDQAGPAGAGRSRGQTVACPSRRAEPGRCQARRGCVRACRRSGLGRRQALRRQRFQDRAGATTRRAHAHPRRGGNAAAPARPSRLALLLPSRSPRVTTNLVPPLSSPHVRHGSNVGQPLTRRDGVLKVTGKAIYAADNHPPGLLYAVMAISSISRGRVASLDVAAAKRHKGVVEVMTPANRPALAQDPDEKSNPFMFRLDLLQNDRVRYANQPIAVVIAESLEAATEGAVLLAPQYQAEPARIGLDDTESFVPPGVGVGMPAEVHKGDVEAGLTAAAKRIDATYETPAQYHNALEPHAIVAAWKGDSLSIDTPTQALEMARGRIAGLFGIAAEKIHIRSPFLGGGFGSKGLLAGPQVLGILAARMVGRPVKLVMRRDQMYGPVGHRSPTRQHLRLGMTGDGALTALDHHAKMMSSTFDDFFEPAANISHSLYASPAIATHHEAARADIGTPMFMRAPGEATGSIALESAIDEAATACDMDPLAFRLRNYAEVEPFSGKPFSSKALRECYAQGAERFGWASRPLLPRQMRDKDGFLVGWGMGTATFPALMFQGHARAVIRRDGSGLVESGAHDMGQGAWTALAQIAADGLGLDIDRVEFRAGSSDLPDAGIAGGSAHTATAGIAIHNAGGDAIARLAVLATGDERSPLYGAGNEGVIARDGRLHRRDREGRSESYADILARAGLAEIEGTGSGAADPDAQSRWAMYAHGAVFAEVKVDPDLGQIRTTRLVGAFAAGRVINPRLVRSQYYGGMIWGVSFALHEQAIVDRRTGRVMNADLGEYHVPVSADIGSLEALLVHEDDAHVNPLGIKGVGEIAVTGTAGAVANAVWHATGVRVRRFPIRLEDLLTG